MIELGQVKKEALRLMFVSYDEDLDSYEDMYDNSNYISYLLGMPGAINRCFDRIKSARKQPKRVIDLTSYVVDYDEYAMTNQYNLNSISDYDSLDRIIFISSEGAYNGNANYQLDGSMLILDNWDGTYRISYYIKLPTITKDTSDNTMLSSLGVTDEIARMLPYFIKAELYEEDQPNLAAQARGLFEMMLGTLYKTPSNKQTKVKDVYEGL